MDLINQFIDNYKKKFNYYESVGRLAAGQLEAVLRSSGIRAMVTYRAKKSGTLKKARFSTAMPSARFLTGI